MTSRRRSREVAFNILFALECNQIEPEESLRRFEDNFQGDTVPNISPKDVDLRFVKQLVFGANSKRDEILERLDNQTGKWRLERIGFVERALLLLAMFEIYYYSSTPTNVAINEAIELAKKYGQEETSAFINGILDTIVVEH